eukprot:TRINITY_DN3217_c0_g1_i8.p2 TRINITY_DN3217_c0_g1~~TRINITY_DN3217_c0_g1_i8.p2  ORF type:complete len:258 (-),score=78.61 TRINITY_DN3217_c0_g1_i8:682-1455(-)
MSQLFIAVFVALLSYVDGQVFASAHSGPGGNFITTSTPYYRIVTKEEKPKPTIIIVEDPAPKPAITIVADKKEEEATEDTVIQLTTTEEEEKEDVALVIGEADADEEEEEAAPAPKKNRRNRRNNKKDECSTIVDVAVATPELSILVEALTAAGLVDTLDDPTLIVTVVAPTNEAFEALLETFDATLEQVLADPQLTNILLYHVIGGTASTADKLEDGSVLTTVLGQGLTVDKSDGTVLTTVLGFCWCWIYGQCCGC